MESYPFNNSRDPEKMDNLAELVERNKKFINELFVKFFVNNTMNNKIFFVDRRPFFKRRK